MVAGTHSFIIMHCAWSSQLQLYCSCFNHRVQDTACPRYKAYVLCQRLPGCILDQGAEGNEEACVKAKFKNSMTPMYPPPPPGPAPPLGNCTTTVQCPFGRRLGRFFGNPPPEESSSVESGLESEPEHPTTCAKTGSPVEGMNITFVPGGEHGCAVKFYFSESEQNVLPRVQGIQVAVPHNTVTHPTTQ